MGQSSPSSTSIRSSLLHQYWTNTSRTLDRAISEASMNGTSSSQASTHVTGPFLSSLDAASQVNRQDDPNYYAKDPNSLVSTSNVHTFSTGTGSTLYRSLVPLLESTNSELILVTCFWARSSTLETLSSILRNLSKKAIYRGTEKIRVHLCFSSLSLFQKLFHTQSTKGQIYPPEVWHKKLGLPPPSELAGLDIRIKSVFLLPFSVMHPKFMIIDRQTVILPSCNISWEEWFEGYMTFSGHIVSKFLYFYAEFWERKPASELAPLPSSTDTTKPSGIPGMGGPGSGSEDPISHEHGHTITFFSSFPNSRSSSEVPTIFLPSPHHRNPRFSPFASQSAMERRCPPTPLNLFILTLMNKAEHSIRIQTPNLTSPPVLSALLRALERGVSVRILTSEKLMVLEQLVTAGTTTKSCVKKLIKRYRKLLGSAGRPGTPNTDVEVAFPSHTGTLHISYFSPIPIRSRSRSPNSASADVAEPQQSHLKMLIVDEEVLVLGSGNLDRASWFTSQELGVAVFDREIASRVGRAVDAGMEGRGGVVFDSEAS